MAYKFQLGTAILSGALDQEGDVVVLNGGDPTKGNISGSRDLSFAGSLKVAGVSLTSAELAVIDGVTAGTLTAGKAAVVDSNKDLSSFRSITGSGDVDFANGRFSATVNAPKVIAEELTGSLEFKLSKAANSGLAMTDFNNTANVSDLKVDLNSLSAAAVAMGADSIAIIDADDSSATKKESIADFMTQAAGDGLAASSGVLSVGVDDSTIETNSDALRLKDDGVTGAKLHPDVAGAGLGQDGSGNLDVQVSGAIAIAADKLGISGSFAGIGLAFDGPVGHITGIDLDLNELQDAGVEDGDSFAFIDANDSNVTKKVHVADVATLFAGAGLGAASSVISVANATNGGLAVNANDVQLDLNDLSAASVSVANDSIAIIDADDSNGTKKESIADLVAAFAGAGLTATNGVLSTQAGAVTPIVQATTTLTEGYNFATGSGALSVALPIDNSIGDTVTVKALEDGQVTINRAGGQTIDGGTSIILESPGAAVTCVYLKSGSWGIV